MKSIDEIREEIIQKLPELTLPELEAVERLLMQQGMEINDVLREGK
jgi:hypothetical protein